MKIDFKLPFLCFVCVCLSLFSWSTRAQAQGLDLDYTLTIDDPSSHIITVKLDVANITSSPLKLTRQIPYQTNPTILSITVSSGGSSIPYTIDYSDLYYETYVINVTGSVTVEYSMDLEFTPQGGSGVHGCWNLDELYGAIEAHLLFLQPGIDSTISNCEVRANLPTDWKLVSRFTDRGGYYEANVDDKVVIYNHDPEYEFIIWGPIAFGDFDEYVSTIGGVEAEVAFYGNDALQAEISGHLLSVFDYLTQAIGPLNDPAKSSKPIRYLYVLLHETQRVVHTGDHIYGQITTTYEGDSDRMRYRGDAHMISHTWFSHFGIVLDAIYVTGWISEGIIQFYALKSLEMAGIWTASEVNDHLIGWYNDYKDYILGTAYDVPIFPESGWINFPDDPLPSLYSYGIRRIIWYEKLPLVFRMLDWKIGDVTQGQKSLDDVWHHSDPYYYGKWWSGDMCYDELLTKCNNLVGLDFSNFFQKYIAGKAQLPYYIEGGTLKNNYSEIPEPTELPEDEDGDGGSDGGGGGGCFISTVKAK